MSRARFRLADRPGFLPGELLAPPLSDAASSLRLRYPPSPSNAGDCNVAYRALLAAADQLQIAWSQLGADGQNLSCHQMTQLRRVSKLLQATRAEAARLEKKLRKEL
jgi:hypothetical protein